MAMANSSAPAAPVVSALAAEAEEFLELILLLVDLLNCSRGRGRDYI